MKKLLLLSLIALGMLSCIGPQGPQGPAGKDGFVNYKIIDLQVNQNEWGYSNMPDNNYFTALFDIPELTQHIYDNGLIQVYREYNTGTTDAVQQLLPMTRHKEYQIEGTGEWGFFTETVDYEYGLGFLNIFYTASDFDYELDKTFVPESMHFRLVIMW